MMDDDTKSNSATALECTKSVDDNAKSMAIEWSKKVFNATSDRFDSLLFWDTYGSRTIDLLELQPGQRVLDVCCGSGSSAIPAAMAVGSSGSVIAVDLAVNLLELGQKKADQKGLSQLEFREGALENLEFPNECFDVIICVFGIFFLPDMPAALKELGRMLRPGGKLGITSWGTSLLEPANKHFWDVIQLERPDLCKTTSPWDHIKDPIGLKSLIESALPAVSVNVFQENDKIPLHQPEDWWNIVLGSGYLGVIDQLDSNTKEKVRDMNLKCLQDNNVRELHSEVLYAIGQKEL